MTFLFSARSEEKLQGVHPDLVKVVRMALYVSRTDFVIIEGVRTLEKQLEYYRAGKSRTKKSRHLTGHAVDIMPWLDTDDDGDKEGSWEREHFYPINDAMREASSITKIPVEWGGSWSSFPDMPHWQLPWSKYP